MVTVKYVCMGNVLYVRIYTVRVLTYLQLRYPVPSPSPVTLLEQISNNPTVHYTTASLFIQFPHFMYGFIQNRCVWISEV